MSSHSFQVGDFILQKFQMTKDRHKLSPTYEGPYEVVEVTQPGSYRLQHEDGSEVQNSWNDDQLRPFFVGNFFVQFCLLPATLAHGANTSVRGLHYALIYVSYNEILPLLHLFHFCANNIFTSAVKNIAWLG
jgi:hypothetical protein